MRFDTTFLIVGCTYITLSVTSRISGRRKLGVSGNVLKEIAYNDLKT